MRKLIIVMMCLMLILPVVTAFEFDNIKDYDEDTRVTTITNALGLGDTIAKITSITPIKFKVGVGYVYVWERHFENFDDYANALADEKYYNVRDKMNPVEIELDYKYKTIELVKGVYDKCTLNEKTMENTCIETPYEREVVKWKDYNTKDMLEGNITLRGYTITEEGDKIENIPTYYGKSISELSEWTASLNVDILSYYAFETNSGETYFDTTPNVYNLTMGQDNEQGLWNSSGKIGNSSWFNGNASMGARSPNRSFNNEQFSISTWAYLDPASALDMVWEGEYGDDGFAMWYEGTEYVCNMNNGAPKVTGTSSPSKGAWHMITCVWDYANNNASIFIDGDHEVSEAMPNPSSLSSSIGSIANLYTSRTTTWKFTGRIDELGIWNRSLTQAEITQLYNGGTGITYTATFGNPPTVNLTSPVDNYNSTVRIVQLKCLATDDVKVANVSLFIDDVLSSTVGNPPNNTNTTFNWNFASDGTFDWNCQACNNASECTNGTARTINIDTAPIINIFSPVGNESIILDTSIFFNATSSLSVDTWIVNFNGTNITLSDINTTLDVLEGSYRLLMYANNSASGQWGLNDSVYFTVHFTPVNLTIFYPNTTIPFFEVGNNLTLNWSVTEEGRNLSQHVRNCSYTYNGVTVSLDVNVTCIGTNQTNFTYVNGVNNITMTVIEEFNFTTNTTVTWDFELLVINKTFNSPVIEGANEQIRIDLQTNGTALSTANLFYNGTAFTGSIFSSGNDYIVLINNNIPSVSIDENVSFFWNLIMADSFQANTTSNNQTILSLGIDNCTGFSGVLFNFSLVDEATQLAISNNSIIETAFNIYSADKTILISNFSEKSSNVSYTSICLENALNESVSSFILDAVVKYEEGLHAIEYYNFFNYTLDNQTSSQNVTLYDLLLTDSTEFQLTFTGSDFVVVENALISVQRQYISENVFKTVELPKTDANGQTILHLVRNDVVYNIIVTRNGVVLGTFQNIRAFCEDFTIGDCKLNLNAFDSSEAVFDYDGGIGLIFTAPTYDSTSRVITFNFVTDDSTEKTVLMEVTRNDIFGNRTVCNSSVTSSGGTLTCNVPSNIDDSTLITDISVDGILSFKEYSILPTTGFGAGGYFISFIMMIAFIMMFAQSKSTIIFGVVLGFLCSLVFGLIQGQAIGLGSAGGWLILIAIIMIWKLNKTREN